MKVLMLGWEYPPYISGGLGTACQGLTTALASLGEPQIDFIVPRLLGRESAPHMTLVDSYVASSEFMEEAKEGGERNPSSSALRAARKQLRIVGISAALSPYLKTDQYRKLRKLLLEKRKDVKNWQEEVVELNDEEQALLSTLPYGLGEIFQQSGPTAATAGQHYGADLFGEVARFARNVVLLARDREFDLIHAHDWMTFPAGVALSKLTGKPLVVHIHSLEFDRSGSGGDQRIREIEKAGTEAATKVIAVSYYTRNVIHEQHGTPLEKIFVVHNGVYTGEVVRSYQSEERVAPRAPDEKTVLFLGRITFQKGPDYFVEAAARVVPILPSVKFVMAGSGDMLPRLKERVEELGISKHFLFTGFLKGQDVEKAFSMADLYVMPSVSEPFGIAPLEAMSHDVPVIISRQSGVSEVLRNAFKVDYWDIDKLSGLIIGVLKYPEVKEDIIRMAREEVRRLRWDAAAKKVQEIYHQTLGMQVQQGA